MVQTKREEEKNFHPSLDWRSKEESWVSSFHQERCPHTRLLEPRGYSRRSKSIEAQRSCYVIEEAWRTTTRIEVSRSSKQTSIQVRVFTLELVYGNSSILIYDMWYETLEKF